MNLWKSVLVGLIIGLGIGGVTLMAANAVSQALLSLTLPLGPWLAVVLVAGGAAGSIGGGSCHVLTVREQSLLGLFVSSAVAAMAILSHWIDASGWQPLGLYLLVVIVGYSATRIACLLIHVSQPEAYHHHPELRS